MIAVGPDGQVVGGAFGPVGLEDGPRQTARDGEDAAVAALARFAEGPVTLAVDCAGTLGALAAGPSEPLRDPGTTSGSAYGRHFLAGA